MDLPPSQKLDYFLTSSLLMRQNLKHQAQEAELLFDTNGLETDCLVISQFSIDRCQQVKKKLQPPCPDMHSRRTRVQDSREAALQRLWRERWPCGWGYSPSSRILLVQQIAQIRPPRANQLISVCDGITGK